MKLLRVLALGLMLPACSSVPYHAFYVPANNPSEPWTISGHAELDVHKDKIIITINNELGITGMLSKDKPKGSFVGSYRQQPLSADCTITPSGLVYNHQCKVFVDGKYAATLNF